MQHIFSNLSIFLIYFFMKLDPIKLLYHLKILLILIFTFYFIISIKLKNLVIFDQLVPSNLINHFINLTYFYYIDFDHQPY